MEGATIDIHGELPSVDGELIEDVLADEGEFLSCILEKILITPKKSTNSQRHAIFCTRRTN